MKRLARVVAALSLALCLVVALGTFAAAANLEMTVPKVKKAPTIDGKLNDAAWLEASINGGKTVVDLDNNGVMLTEYPRIAYICYDDTALYIAFKIFAPDVNKLMTTAGSIWSNDEVEIFLEPNKKGAYTQWGIDAGGNIDSSDPSKKIEHAITKSGICWNVEAAIPWKSVGVTPKVGDKWGLNLCGHQIATGAVWVCWNCTFGGFHNPSAFGTIVFGN